MRGLTHCETMSQSLTDSETPIHAVLFVIMFLTKLEIENYAHGHNTSWNSRHNHTRDEGTDINFRVWPSPIVKASTGMRGAVTLHATCLATI